MKVRTDYFRPRKMRQESHGRNLVANVHVPIQELAKLETDHPPVLLLFSSVLAASLNRSLRWILENETVVWYSWAMVAVRNAHAFT